MTKVEEIGDPEAIEKLMQFQERGKRTFADVKDEIEETRLRATDLFSKKKISSAIKLYHFIVQAAELALSENEKDEKDRRNLLYRIHTNLAVCSNKIEDFHTAIEHIQRLEALDGIENQPKALFAKGYALMMLSEYTEASKSLVKALKLRPLDQQIIDTIQVLKKRKDDNKEFMKTFHKNLKLA